MPEIVLRNISKRFGKAGAVENLDLTIHDGDFVTLLGPSGCGKTTTLRMIAGLETPTEGEISIDGKVVFSAASGLDVTPDKRDVGFLFQNYALWPHMTVRTNIAFGLENMKWSAAAIKDRVAELLSLLRIEDYADRYPAELSGGQQQRVAIARTLAPRPRVLLMDEPLSNLDAKLRMEMRTELKRLHVDTRSTFVYVTHDQLEAMTLSSKVCLLRQGYLQQYSPPLEVYGQPANTFVADFVGSPSINLIQVKGTSHEQGIRIRNADLDLLFVPDEPLDLPSGTDPEGASLVLGMRPETLTLNSEGAEDSGGDIQAVVYSSLPSGMETILRLQAGGTALTSVVFGSIDFAVNETVSLRLSRAQLFEGTEGRRMASGTLRVWR